MMVELDEENCSLYALNENKLFEIINGEEGLLDPIDRKSALAINVFIDESNFIPVLNQKARGKEENKSSNFYFVN
jgi:hypothetical protein